MNPGELSAVIKNAVRAPRCHGRMLQTPDAAQMPAARAVLIGRSRGISIIDNNTTENSG